MFSEEHISELFTESVGSEDYFLNGENCLNKLRKLVSTTSERKGRKHCRNGTKSTK